MRSSRSCSPPTRDDGESPSALAAAPRAASLYQARAYAAAHPLRRHQGAPPGQQCTAAGAASSRAAVPRRYAARSRRRAGRVRPRGHQPGSAGRAAPRGEDHERLRRIAHRAFTPRRIAEMRATIQSYCDELLDPLEGRDECDLMPFAYRFPLMVISDILSVPDEEGRDEIRGWGNRIARHFGSSDPALVIDAHHAIEAFRAYAVGGVIARHREDPRPAPSSSRRCSAQRARSSSVRTSWRPCSWCSCSPATRRRPT